MSKQVVYKLGQSRAATSILLAIALAFALGSCVSGSIYRFQSQPSEAQVYYINGGEKTAIGVTPIDYTKASLPSDAPFTLLFEKPGFEPREISVAPTDNSQTTVSATLKPARVPSLDAATKRVREVLRRIFEIQEMTAKQKFVDALAALTKLEESEPNVAEISSMKGSIYYLLKDPEQAKQQWEKALKIDPNLEDVRVRLSALKTNSAKTKVTP